MSDGFVLVDKPPGPTSHDVVDVVRQAYGTRRAGHAGTLDPFASGLLIVLVGRATRLSQYLVGLPKRYTGAMTLGVETDTEDPTGDVTRTDDGWRTLADSAVRSAMASLTGRSLQHPPAHSARKQDGERAYRRARRGDPVELEPREIDVMRFEMTAREGSTVEFAAEVSSGTYLRALARDLGRALGCGAHLAGLRRTHVGSFSVAEAVAVETLRRQAPALRAPREAVGHLTTITLDTERRGMIVHGQPVPAADVAGGPVALVAGGELVAIAQRQGEVLKPKVVLEG
ncbi:MAG: tRNA pseudouridine(55) synthase TruB [Gemmatimonadota bacterium]|nr:MAG: tRNA pseudouridine(55) synthase TruB [Gemmatimonadota bacterium]